MSRVGDCSVACWLCQCLSVYQGCAALPCVLGDVYVCPGDKSIFVDGIMHCTLFRCCHSNATTVLYTRAHSRVLLLLRQSHPCCAGRVDHSTTLLTASAAHTPAQAADAAWCRLLMHQQTHTGRSGRFWCASWFLVCMYACAQVEVPLARLLQNKVTDM